MTARHHSSAPPASKAAPRFSTWARLRLSVGRQLDKRLTPLGIWLYRRTKGGITRPWKVNAFLLTTRGRRSGRERTVVLQYFPDGEAMVIAAANDGGPAHPGWYFNLSANPTAIVEVMGRTVAVRAEELPPAEAAAWRQRILLRSPSYEQYTRATTRIFPIVRLVPVSETARRT
jgi:deazaflavin-dependent oxidoreductase (nitroreductase family)